MKDATVCFPHQLFENNPFFKPECKIYLIEDSLFFGDAQYPFLFHKKKLVFHRATMQSYKDFLINHDYSVKYFEYKEDYRTNINKGSIHILFNYLQQDNVNRLHCLNFVDWAIEKRMKFVAKQSGIRMIFKKSPAFLCDKDYLERYFETKDNYLHASFYIAQRKKLKILLEDGNKPKGGKWSYDAENRKKLPKEVKIPPFYSSTQNYYVKNAIKYVEQRFPDNPGTTEGFFYPIDHKSALEWFQEFLTTRFAKFGLYEDAIKKDDPFLFHSMISPLLNVGLLTPEQVIEEIFKFTEKSSIPLNSLEGFIRQVIGWREFMRAIYLLEGVKQRNSNFWAHKYPIPPSFYNGNTGIKPLDNTIKHLLEHAYIHHIERLMIVGNFMLLCEIEPNEVYRWFMEMFIDSYDWVMVPNVYGMSQNADGGLITTKPYISSSNYILKMSDYKKDKSWCDVWDGLYWRFINKHRNKFKKNPRMRMMVSVLNKMKKEKLDSHLSIAEAFLKKLHSL